MRGKMGRIVYITLVFYITLCYCGSSEGTVSNSSCSGPRKSYYFAWEDYSLILALMIISCAIGTFYCLCDKKQMTSNDFLLGGGSSSFFTMALSLTSGFITAIELLGNPAEMYNFGIQLWMTCISLFFVIPIASYLYLPVFMGLRLTSCYEYLQLRFHHSARFVASILYILQTVLYTSVAIYAPALAVSKVTGMNVYMAVSIIYIICIFYASQGGMKAVIITDTFQALILVFSILTIVIIANSHVGGISTIFADNFRSGRLNFFSMSGDHDRHDLWSVVLGGIFYWTTMYCSSQSSIQKYLTVKSLRNARKALWVSCFGLVLIFTVNFYTGMILYSAFKSCDPIDFGEVSSSDELLPFFVMKMLSHLRGLPGLFVAGIFSASLGTVAAALNSLAAVSTKDFLSGAFGIKLPENREAYAAKWISVIFGIISFGLVLLVKELGSVLQAALSFNGMIGGVTLGMFSLGMFCPWTNTKGVIFGSLTALVVTLWIGIGAQLATLQGILVYVRKETSLAGCSCLSSHLNDPHPTEKNSQVFALHKISFLWYSAISFGITIIMGNIFSFITGMRSLRHADLDLFSPPVRNLIKHYLEKSRESPDFPIFKEAKTKRSEIPHQFTLGITNFATDLTDEKLQDAHNISAK